MPFTPICELAEARKLSLKFADESYGPEPEPPIRLINAFTRAAQKLAPLQTTEVEWFAGTLLEAS
jgi:hypothetical protein